MTARGITKAQNSPESIARKKAMSITLQQLQDLMVHPKDFPSANLKELQAQIIDFVLAGTIPSFTGTECDKINQIQEEITRRITNFAAPQPGETLSDANTINSDKSKQEKLDQEQRKNYANDVIFPKIDKQIEHLQRDNSPLYLPKEERTAITAKITALQDTRNQIQTKFVTNNTPREIKPNIHPDAESLRGWVGSFIKKICELCSSYNTPKSATEVKIESAIKQANNFSSAQTPWYTKIYDPNRRPEPPTPSK